MHGRCTTDMTIDVYERPCSCRLSPPRTRDTTPRTGAGTGPASCAHRAPVHMASAAIAAAIARTPSTPATARNTARTLPRKRDRHTDPVRADATSALHVRAQRSRRTVCSPVCNTCVRQPHAGRSAVAAPVRSGRCRGSGSARSPAVLAAARATAERNTTAELQR